MTTKVNLVFPVGHLGANYSDSAVEMVIRALSLKYGNQNDWCDKYGCNYEDDTILIHRFCWCEEENCPWCGAECGCPDALIEHYLDGVLCGEWNEKVVTVYGPRIHSCDKKSLFVDRIEWGLDWRPRSDAPNFWHKPSGFKAWWYKYIGRDMEYYGAAPQNFIDLVTEEDIQAVIKRGDEVRQSFMEVLRRGQP